MGKEEAHVQGDLVSFLDPSCIKRSLDWPSSYYKKGDYIQEYH